MPISPIVLQRRHAELGRIRLGAKRNGNGAPMKLEQFRFTTHSERYAHDLAELYGGEARPWDNNGVASWEVYSTAISIPVIAVKGGLSQWMETWSGGGCVHRCDGERQADGEMCDLKDHNHINAKPTTRLSVMLPELEAIGVWRMESHGWNAAAEIPAVAELAQYVGDLVPANLHLVERRSIKDGKTSRFVVPVLDLQIGTARLREIVASVSGAPEIKAPAPSSAPALEAAKPDVRIPTPEEIAAATSREVLDQMWRDVAGHPYQDRIREAVVARITALQEEGLLPSGQESPQAQGDDGIVDAEIVPDVSGGQPDAEQVWGDILKAGGERGMQLPDIEQDVRAFLNGGDVDGPHHAGLASAEEFQAYLNILLARAA